MSSKPVDSTPQPKNSHNQAQSTTNNATTSGNNAQGNADTVPAPSRRDWFGLAVLSVGLGMIVLDGTIVGVALPSIVIDLKLSLTDAQWVSALYTVILAALLLSTGKLADKWGRKKMFLAGVAIFVVGSLTAAMSDSTGPLLWSRALQALGAAILMPSTLSSVNAVFRGKYRAAAFGVWGAVMSGAAAIGPLAGGALTEYLSWHWVFLVNIPLGIIIFVAGMFTVPETRSSESLPGADVDGAQLSIIGFGALIFAVVEGPTLGWWKPIADFSIFGFTWGTSAPISIIPVMLAIAVVALALFVVWERHRKRVHRSAILNLSLFSYSTFSWGNVTATAVAIGEFALIFVLPLYLVNARGLSTMETGLVLAAKAVGAFFSGAAARHVAARYGSAGTVLFGLAGEVVGVIGVIALINAPVWVMAISLTIYGLGLGLASAQLTSTVLSEIPVDNSGQGSATQSTVRQVGSALGTAISGAALSAALAVIIPNKLSDAGMTGPAADHISAATRDSAGSAIIEFSKNSSQLGSDGNSVVHALTEGFAQATQWSMGAALVFLVIGFIGAVRVRQAAKADHAGDN